MTVKELREEAKRLGLTGYSKMNKAQLEEAVNNAQTQAQEQAHDEAAPITEQAQPAVVEQAQAQTEQPQPQLQKISASKYLSWDETKKISNANYELLFNCNTKDEVVAMLESTTKETIIYMMHHEHKRMIVVETRRGSNFFEDHSMDSWSDSLKFQRKAMLVEDLARAIMATKKKEAFHAKMQAAYELEQEALKWRPETPYEYERRMRYIHHLENMRTENPERYEKIRVKSVKDGIIRPDDLPSVYDTDKPQTEQPAVVEYDPEFVEDCYTPDYQDCPAVLDDIPEPRDQAQPTPIVEQPQPQLLKISASKFLTLKQVKTMKLADMLKMATAGQVIPFGIYTYGTLRKIAKAAHLKRYTMMDFVELRQAVVDAGIMASPQTELEIRLSGVKPVEVKTQAQTDEVPTIVLQPTIVKHQEAQTVSQAQPEQPQPEQQTSAPVQKATLPHMERCPHCRSKHKPYFSYKEGNNASYATRRFNGGEYHEWEEARLTCRDCGHVVSLVFSKPYPDHQEAMKQVVGKWALASCTTAKPDPVPVAVPVIAPVPTPVPPAETHASATPKPHTDNVRKPTGKYSSFSDEIISACTTRAQLAELFSHAANRKVLLDTFSRLNLCDPHRLLCSQEKLADYLANEIMITRQDQRQPLALGTLSDRVIHKGKAIVRLVAGAIGSFFKL